MGQTLAQMYLTCGWIEAIFFGIKVLLLASVLQFLLAGARAIISIAELLLAFTYSINGADTYYSDLGGDELFIAGFAVYITNSFVEELLLIWRLYVIYDKNIKICTPRCLVLWVTHVCIASVAVSGLQSLGATSGTFKLHVFSLAGWAFGAAVNLSATLLIAYRLWRAERNLSSLSTHFNYRASILIVVECGALITLPTLIMLVLYSSGHPIGIVGIGVTTQLATMAPLLIIARFGIVTGRIQSSAAAAELASSLIPNAIEVSVTRDENRPGGFPMTSMPKKLSGAEYARSEDEKSSGPSQDV
ncbi:hypothetical protein BU15DRAFT_80188 [Melanogaster broomeanus]|nr:hypothetical protein BU15DRAFT_80188 [Melanogaster broomeanus]